MAAKKKKLAKPLKPLSKSALKKLIAKLDRKATKVFNKYIREYWRTLRDTCPLCEKNPISCCFHVVSAMRKKTRYDERNVIGACTPCNKYENYFSDLSRAWYLRTFGLDTYLAVVDKASEPFEFTRDYLENIIAHYSLKLEELMKPKL